MKKNFLALIALISLVAVFTASPSAQTQPTSPQAPLTADAQLATIKEYCAGCHNDRAKTGGVSFEGITPASIGQHADVFEKAVRKLRGRVMPPPGAKQPEAKSIDSLVAWLEASLNQAEGKSHVPD